MIDLRSDTITKPTAEMRQVIATAEVGDDVFGDDPSVCILEGRVADLFGKEAALFVPTGTMANQLSIRAHTEPGDEIIAADNSHIFLYEGGGFAALSGVSLNAVRSVDGLLKPFDVEAAIRPTDSLSHCPLSRLICLENTSNRGGGKVYSLAATNDIAEIGRKHLLKMHLDGARIFNASVFLDVSVKEIASYFDSLTCCLSKGLGCPAGSLIVGTRAFIDRCHRFRKMFGGGMRQVGILAAAGTYALSHHVNRLAEDHMRAKALAEAISALGGFNIDLRSVETNMVYVDVQELGKTASEMVALLAERNVAVTSVDGSTLRAVTHLEIDDVAIHKTIEAFKGIAL